VVSQVLYSFSGKEALMARETGSGITPENLVIALNIELKNKSLNSISKAAGVGISALHRYQRGIGEPTTSTLERLSDYFKVSVAWLRGDSPMTYEDEQLYNKISFNIEDDIEEHNRIVAELMITAQSLDLSRLTRLNARAEELFKDFLEEFPAEWFEANTEYADDLFSDEELGHKKK
jgi:transcriptional regulator with XRE-family HTH domain